MTLTSGDGDPAEVVRAAFLATNNGDVDGFLACLHPQVEWESLGVFLKPAGVLCGPSQIRAAFVARAGDSGQHPRITLTDISRDGDIVFVTGIVQALNGSRMPETWVCEMRQRLIFRVSAFATTGSVAAAWRGRSSDAGG